MVESTAKTATANVDAPDFIHMDQLDSTTEVWYSNVLALIKLK